MANPSGALCPSHPDGHRKGRLRPWLVKILSVSENIIGVSSIFPENRTAAAPKIRPGIGHVARQKPPPRS